MKAQKNEHISILDYKGNWDRGSLGLVRVMVLVTIGTSCVAMVCWVTMARHNILNNFYCYNWHDLRMKLIEPSNTFGVLDLIGYGCKNCGHYILKICRHFIVHCQKK